jgi:hypothetical protein
MAEADFYGVLRDVPPELQDVALQVQRAKEAIDAYLSGSESKRRTLLREAIPGFTSPIAELFAILHSLKRECVSMFELLKKERQAAVGSADKQQLVEQLIGATARNIDDVEHAIDVCHHLQDCVSRTDHLVRELLS